MSEIWFIYPDISHKLYHRILKIRYPPIKMVWCFFPHRSWGRPCTSQQCLAGRSLDTRLPGRSDFWSHGISVRTQRELIIKMTSNQWPWLRIQLIGGTDSIYKAYFSGLCKGISPQNMAKNMVQYLHFRILKYPLTERSQLFWWKTTVLFWKSWILWILWLLAVASTLLMFFGVISQWVKPWRAGISWVVWL